MFGVPRGSFFKKTTKNVINFQKIMEFGSKFEKNVLVKFWLFLTQNELSKSRKLTKIRLSKKIFKRIIWTKKIEQNLDIDLVYMF